MSQPPKNKSPQIINPNHINPQFIGIGQKLSQHKKARIQSNLQLQNIQSTYTFSMKLNQQLDHTLKSKQKQLQRLKSVRERYHQDIQFKADQQQRKREEVRKLRDRSEKQRVSLKEGIKQARENLRDNRLANKIRVREGESQRKESFRAQVETSSRCKYNIYQSVEFEKRKGRDRINNFHRYRNLKSLTNYNQRIEEQQRLNNQNIQNIEIVSSEMKHLEKRIKRKQQKLKHVLGQISTYTTQNQRKANFLAGFSTRPSITSQSWRSKPSDLLMHSFDNVAPLSIEM